jgi:hypothetical protein
MLLDKFRSCLKVGPGVEQAAANRLAETAMGLDREPDAAILSRMFPAVPPLSAIMARPSLRQDATGAERI